MKDRFRGQVAYACFLFLLSGLLFFLDSRGWLKSIRGIVQIPIVTAEKKVFSLKQLGDSFFKLFVYRRYLEKELLRLQIDVQKLAMQQNTLSSCLEENEKMRRLLGAPLPPKWKFLAARVAGISGSMRIDKGLKEGLKVGMIVVSENILVGKVASVGENDSLVQLPATPGTKIPVVVKSPQAGKSLGIDVQARGLLTGQYGGMLVLDRVLQEEEIQKGDFVVTSGDEEWASDLLIGEIVDVLPKSAEIYRKAQVKPFVDYGKLTTVFVVITR